MLRAGCAVLGTSAVWHRWTGFCRGFLFVGLFVFFCVVVPVVLACLPAHHFRRAVLFLVLFAGCTALGPTNIWHQWTSFFDGLLCVALLVFRAAVVVLVVLAC